MNLLMSLLGDRGKNVEALIPYKLAEFSLDIVSTLTEKLHT